MEITREQTESALTDVSAPQCSSYIAQAHAYLSSLMLTNAALNLSEHATLQALVDSLPRADDQVAPMLLC